MAQSTIKHLRSRRLNASQVRTVCGKIVKVAEIAAYAGEEPNCQDCIDQAVQTQPIVRSNSTSRGER